LIKWDSFSYFHYLINVNDRDLQLWIKTCERGLTSVDISRTLSALSTFLSCVTFISSSTRHNLYRLRDSQKSRGRSGDPVFGRVHHNGWTNWSTGRFFTLNVNNNRHGEGELRRCRSANWAQWE